MSDEAKRLEEVDQVLTLVRAELQRVISKKRRYASTHEAYGVLLEEVDEVWDEVKADQHDLAAAEAVQVAAVAVRLVADICRLHNIPLPSSRRAKE